MSIAEDKAVSMFCRHRGTEKPAIPLGGRNCLSETWVLSRIREIDATARECPACKAHQATLKRVDHYLCLFRIPVMRVRKGEPFLACNGCESIIAKDYKKSRTTSKRICSTCGRALYGDVYCPICGRQV